MVKSHPSAVKRETAAIARSVAHDKMHHDYTDTPSPRTLAATNDEFSLTGIVTQAEHNVIAVTIDLEKLVMQLIGSLPIRDGAECNEVPPPAGYVNRILLSTNVISASAARCEELLTYLRSRL